MKKAIITIILMILVVVITAIFIFCIKEKDVSLLNLQGEIIMPSQYFDPDKRGIMYINTDNATVEFDPNIDIAYSFGEKDVFYYATSEKNYSDNKNIWHCIYKYDRVNKTSEQIYSTPNNFGKFAVSDKNIYLLYDKKLNVYNKKTYETTVLKDNVSDIEMKNNHIVFFTLDKKIYLYDIIDEKETEISLTPI